VTQNRSHLKILNILSGPRRRGKARHGKAGFQAVLAHLRSSGGVVGRGLVPWSRDKDKTGSSGAAGVKADQAAVVPYEGGGFITSVRQNEGTACFWFDSLDEIHQARVAGQLQIRQWIVALPDRLCILKSLSLPAADMQEAARMVEFELPSVIPLPLEELAYGCTPVDHSANMLTVLVYILKLKALDHFLQPFREAGLSPRHVIPHSLAVHAWFQGRIPAVSPRSVSTWIGPHRGWVMPCRQGHLAGVESVGWSSKAAEASAEQIAARIQTCCRTLADPPGDPVQCVLGASDGQSMLVKQVLETRSLLRGCAAETVVVTSPETAPVRWSDRRPYADGHTGYEQIVAVGALNGVTGPEYVHANLLPAREIARQQRRYRLRQTAVTGGLIAIVCLLMTAVFWCSNWRIRRACRSLEAAIAPIEDLAQDVDSKRQRIEAVTRQFRDRGMILAVFQDLLELTPPAVTISHLNFETGHAQTTTLRIRGQSDTATAIEYPAVLQKARFLRDIKTDRIGEINRAGAENLAEFQFRCTIDKPDNPLSSKEFP